MLDRLFKCAKELDVQVECKDQAGGHYQLMHPRVRLLVNYWPKSKRRTLHVVGHDAVPRVSPEDAVRVAAGDLSLDELAQPS